MHAARRLLIVSLCLATGFAAAVAVASPPRRASRDTWQQPDRVVADLSLKAGASVADIGAGRGYFTFRLAEAVGETGTVFATEISEKALKPIADKVKAEKIANVRPVLSDPTETKLKAASVDVALLCDVLHHVPAAQRPALTKSIAAAIKPGGYLFVIDWRVDADVPFDKNRRIPKNDLITLAKDAGLTLDAEFLYLKNQLFLRFRKAEKDPE